MNGGLIMDRMIRISRIRSPRILQVVMMYAIGTPIAIQITVTTTVTLIEFSSEL